MVGYVIGREFGYWLLLRYGFYLRITESRIKLGEYLFLRHGGKIVVVGCFVPVLRSIAGILAGANHMPWRQFLLGNALGALAWASIFGFAAYILGRQVERVAGPMVIAIGVVALILMSSL
jgi:membrane protein DedA with SNARE-associated domain